jgi:hypothetical protein
MKAITLSTVAIVSTNAGMVPSLENLRNHTLLSADQAVSPLEKIAHIATFDEVPIFGGQELREQMLKETSTTGQSDLEVFASSVFNSLNRASKLAACNAHYIGSSAFSLMRGSKDQKLQYSSFCEELPSSRLLRESSSIDQLLQ